MKTIGRFFLVLLVLAVLVSGAAVFVGHAVTEGKTNIRYVYVGDLNVSGLTQDETERLLTERGWRERENTPLVVSTLRGVSFEVDPVRAGAIVPLDEVVVDAYSVGHDRDVISNLITAVRSFLQPVDVGRAVSIDTDYIDALIDAAQQRLNEGLDEPTGGELYTVDAHAAEMVLVKGGEGLTLKREGLRAAIVEALEQGRTAISYTELDAEPVKPDFDAIHTAIWNEPANAYYSDDGRFEVTDEIVGCRFDISEAERLWQSAAPGETVTVPLSITWPEVTGEQLRGRLFHDLLGACMTKFPNSGENRRSNLDLCSSRINGFILYPGETFSYNTVVGERTEEAGFLPAPAYVDGDVKDEIGGGACQVSSTLYAATAFAFLETVDRTCHMFKVNYMQMGTDATVTIPAAGKAIDFQFRNNKAYPIKIVTYFDNENSTLTVEVWGTLEDDDYMPVEFDNTYTWQHDYDRWIEPAYPDRPGYSIKLQVEIYSGEDEIGPYNRTLTHRLVIDEDGNTVEDEIINSRLANGNFAMDTYYSHP